MGLMRFLVHPPGSISEDAASRAYFCGHDLIPWMSLNHVAPDELLIERAGSDSGNLHIPWQVEGRGEVTLATSTLIERGEPYLLPLELARGKVQQVRSQLADWQQAGLTVPAATSERLREAINHLSRAACRQHEHPEAAQHAQRAIQLALEVSDTVGALYTEQALAVRHRQAGRLPSLWGVHFGETTLPPATAKLIRGTFNTAVVSFSWRRLETREGQYDWDLFDRQIEFCRQHKINVIGGPLLQLDPNGLPDWLCLWEGDFDNLLSVVVDYVETVVNRYKGQVNQWLCASRINGGDVLSLTEEERVRLTVCAIETVQRIDGATPVMLSFDQPWAEYLRRKRSQLAPLQLADALARSGLALGGVALELNFGYQPGGTYPRDLVDVSRMMDVWSLLGVPLYPSICLPSGNGPDPHARGIARPLESIGEAAWTPGRQQALATQVAALLLAKPSTRGVIWNQLSDAVPHEFPHGGLFDTAGHPKPALDALAKLRRQHLA